jgi:hypothetical protein
VKYCHNCGFKLTLGSEKFCPECGEELGQSATSGKYDNKKSSIGITDTKGELFGVGVSGTGHIIGKEVGYTVQGNVYHLHFGDNVSKEIITGTIQEIKNVPTQIDQSILSNPVIDRDKLEEIEKIQQQINSILEEVNKTEEREGTSIKEIKAENIQISKNDLSIRDYLLRGNEHLYTMTKL